MPARLNPLDRLRRWRSGASNSEKLYGAIVAQARLPIFYRSLGVPDTLEGRFTLLSLHLFVVLHRLKAEGAEGAGIVQGLVDRFSQDMETVLRELGVSDIAHPKEDAGPCRVEHGPAPGLRERLCQGREELIGRGHCGGLAGRHGECESLAAVLSLPIYGQA